MKTTNIWLKLKNLKTDKDFIKYFDTEYERDCYIIRSKYFTNIIIIDYDDMYKFNRG